MSLREQLREILPGVLPESPDQAIKGTELIQLVRYRLQQECSDATLRYHFSVMSCDPGAPIAKVQQGQGYYRRTPLPLSWVNANHVAEQPHLGEAPNAAQDDRMVLRALKLRALFQQYEEAETRFPFPFPLPDAPARDAGWRLPDAALVEWDLLDSSDDGFRLDTAMAQMKRHLNAPPFTITAVKLYQELSFHNVREAVFRAVSAGDWAHQVELVVCAPIPDDQLARSIRRLGSRFGVGVTSLGLKPEALDDLPQAREISDLRGVSLDALLARLTVQRLTPARTTGPLDWSELAQLRKDYPAFYDLFEWVNECTKTARVVPYRDHQRQKENPVNGASGKD